MTIQNALVYAALILIHYFLKGFLDVYIYDGVMKYEIKYLLRQNGGRRYLSRSAL